MKTVRFLHNHRALAIIGAASATVIAIAVTVVVVSDRTSAPAAMAPEVATITVESTDLTNSQLFAGTLGYGTEQAVRSTGGGTITALPSVGATVARGKSLYRVNDRPVPVFFGATPLFRKIGEAGQTGADIRVVARNLAKLGFPTGINVHDRASAWSGQATLALTKWQSKVGLEPTGELSVGQVVVLPGAARVSTVIARLGDGVGEDVVTVTSTDKVVTVDVAASDVSKLATGAEVAIILPDGARVPGTISAVATVVAEKEEGPADGPPTLTVTIAPVEPDDLADFDFASVSVEIITESKAGVLAVPIEALVALREGGYALQRPDGSLVAVTTGAFSRSLVEVSGEGVTDGLEVVTTP